MSSTQKGTAQVEKYRERTGVTVFDKSTSPNSFKPPLSIITVTHLRADVLARRALPSLLNQGCKDFQWVLVNDGKDALTHELLAQLDCDLHLDYIEMDHPSEGFGLCQGRNLGLEVAEGGLVAYLDDDNTAAPTFVEATLDFFARNPAVRCAMVQQSRRRERGLEEGLPQLGRTFVSPSVKATPSTLVRQEELFDSNGFVHVRTGAPQWNPAHRVYADYEYFLRCLGRWGVEAFAVLPEALIEYVQSRKGVIGCSHYGQWAEELQALLARRSNYPVLSNTDCQRLAQLVKQYSRRYSRGAAIPAFV